MAWLHSELRLELSAPPGAARSAASDVATSRAVRRDELNGVRPLAIQRVLVIEDDQDIAALVGLHLRDMNLSASLVSNGREGLQRALGERWDLILLDLSLPELDGIDICQQLRASNHYTPVLILTARTAEQDRVCGLDAGADDYLTKPFSVVELRARVRAILRRVQQLRNAPAASQQTICIDDLEIDLAARWVRRSNLELALTAREFDLLAHFVLHPGRVFSRAQLLDHVWGLSQDAYEHTVSSHINRLRAKLEPDATTHRYLLTVWGVGYRFMER
jgi:two-component system, OmpR family, response regulator